MPIAPSITLADLQHIKDVARWLAIVSLLTAVFPLLTFLRFKNKFPARLPVHFCAASIGLSAALLVGIVDTDACYAQAISIQYFGFALTCWWFIISFNTFLLATGRAYQHLENSYLAVGWLVPVVFTILPAIFDVYQRDAHAWTAHAVSSHVDFGNSTPSVPANWECWLIQKNGSAWPVYTFFDGWMTLAFVIGIPMWVVALKHVVGLHRAAATGGLASDNIAARVRGRSSSNAAFGDAAVAAPAQLSAALTTGETDGTSDEGASSTIILLSYARHFGFILLFFAVFGISIVFRSIFYFGTLTYAPMLAHTIAICGTGIYCFVIFGISSRNWELWTRDLGCRCCDRDTRGASDSDADSTFIAQPPSSSDPLLRAVNSVQAPYTMPSAHAPLTTAASIGSSGSMRLSSSPASVSAFHAPMPHRPLSTSSLSSSPSAYATPPFLNAHSGVSGGMRLSTLNRGGDAAMFAPTSNAPAFAPLR